MSKLPPQAVGLLICVAVVAGAVVGIAGMLVMASFGTPGPAPSFHGMFL